MTTQLRELNASELQKLEEYRQHAIRMAESTDRIDWDKNETALRALYEASGLDQPLAVMKVASPLAGYIAQAAYKDYCVSVLGGEKIQQQDVESFEEHVAALTQKALLECIPNGRKLFGDKTIYDKIRADNTDSTVVHPWHHAWGWSSSSWWRYAAFPHLYVEGFEYSESDWKDLSVWLELCETAHCSWIFEPIAIMCDRPTILTTDAEGELHNTEGAAIEYADGYKIYSVCGIVFDHTEHHLIDKKNELSVEQVFTIPNTEVRRVMLEVVLGGDWLAEHATGETLDTDDQWGELHRFDIPEDTPITMLLVKNHTCDRCKQTVAVANAGCKCAVPIRKAYWERVPDSIESVLGAHAWRWQVDESALSGVVFRA